MKFIVVVQSLRRVWLHNPEDCSPPGSSVHGISQARILEWVAIFFSRGSVQPRDLAHSSFITGGFFPAGPLGKPNVKCMHGIKKTLPFMMTLFVLWLPVCEIEFPDLNCVQWHKTFHSGGVQSCSILCYPVDSRPPGPLSMEFPS